MEPDFDSSDPFDVLGIPADSGKPEIRKAYKTLIRQFRPETHADEFQTIRAAYDHALAGLAWREQMGEWEEDTEDSDGSTEGPDGTIDGDAAPDESSSLEDPDHEDEDEQVFEPVFDQPWPEEEDTSEIPPGSMLGYYLGYAAWTDQTYVEHGLELESLLADSGATAARQRWEALEAELEEEEDDEEGRLTWLRLGTFLVRAQAATGEAKEVDTLLKQIAEDRDIDEECFDVLEFSIVILRARAEVDKVRHKKYPIWFTGFVLTHFDSDPSEINRGLAEVRRRLLSQRKKRELDWLDQIPDDIPDFGTLFHILMHRHAEGMLGLVSEGELRAETGKPWVLDDLDMDLMALEAALTRDRPRHVILNLTTGITFAISAIGFFVIWVISLKGYIAFKAPLAFALLGLAWLLRGCVDRSFAYRFLVRPKVKRFQNHHDVPVALFTALVRIREPSLPALDYYLFAIESDPKLPPRYHKCDLNPTDVSLPYLGNLAPSQQ